MSRRRGSRNTIAQRIFLTVAAVILTGGIWYFSGAGIPLEEASSLAQEVLGTAGEQWDQLKDFSEDLSIPGKASPHPDAGELSLDASIPEGSVRVHVLNVGQALSVLIQTPQANVLIDGGENDTAPDTTGYLQEQGVTRLDLVFNPHPHYDHYGGLRTIMGEIPADAYITPDLPEDQVLSLIVQHREQTSPCLFEYPVSQAAET